ncbi:emerin-like [Neolamprologus brichardi]|uniref:emerin-like n=1 Tax=Neolamprologus brichardi TaxID=32507 RepID=UPI001643A21A|nr:emerin-like [Neolamprologus brichardi]
MSSLSDKSAQEISDLLDEYGIKHGPVVESTRNLYEKKLKEAMAKGKRAKPSPDKTYYREEVSNCCVSLSRGVYPRARPEWNERDYQHETSYSGYSKSKPEYNRSSYGNEPDMYDTPSTYRSTYAKSPPMKSGQDVPDAPKSSRLIPLWVQFVFFLAVAVFLYLVFSTMETNETPKGIK